MPGKASAGMQIDGRSVPLVPDDVPLPLSFATFAPLGEQVTCLETTLARNPVAQAVLSAGREPWVA
jgi:hypothetical protein